MATKPMKPTLTTMTPITMPATDQVETDLEAANTALAKVVAPGALTAYDYGDDEGAGFEHQTKADLSIPFVLLLQALSPSVVKRQHPMALPGNMYNTITEQYYDCTKGFLFVPATTRHMFCKWIPRDKGGGFRGQLPPEAPEVLKSVKEAEKFGKYRLVEGDDILQLTETFYVYGVICSEDGGAESMALLALTATKIKAYKRWMTRLRTVTIPRPGGGTPIRPPLYANLTRITGDAEDNQKGDFFVFGMKNGDPRGLDKSLLLPNDERFLMAKACKDLVDSGQAKVDFDKQGDPGDEAEKAVPF